jgi:hypothetical protein
MQDTERRYITVPEAGRMLGVGRAQAYAHAAAGRILQFGERTDGYEHLAS